MDQDTNEVLFSKNPSAVLPIASITKLMTALRGHRGATSRSTTRSTITARGQVDTEKVSRLAPDGRHHADAR